MLCIATWIVPIFLQMSFSKCQTPHIQYLENIYRLFIKSICYSLVFPNCNSFRCCACFCLITSRSSGGGRCGCFPCFARRRITFDWNIKKISCLRGRDILLPTRALATILKLSAKFGHHKIFFPWEIVKYSYRNHWKCIYLFLKIFVSLGDTL